jgi:hypothetical protein
MSPSISLLVGERAEKIEIFFNTVHIYNERISVNNQITFLSLISSHYFQIPLYSYSKKKPHNPHNKNKVNFS